MREGKITVWAKCSFPSPSPSQSPSSRFSCVSPSTLGSSAKVRCWKGSSEMAAGKNSCCFRSKESLDRWHRDRCGKKAVQKIREVALHVLGYFRQLILVRYITRLSGKRYFVGVMTFDFLCSSDFPALWYLFRSYILEESTFSLL